MPKIVKTRYACPAPGCGAQIQAESGQLVCTANSNHRWNDIATFMGLNPQVKYEEAKPPVVAQTNYVKVRVRNRGLGDYHSGGGMKVKLYWAKGGTSLGWPSPWKDGSRYGGLVGEVDVGDVFTNPVSTAAR